MRRDNQLDYWDPDDMADKINEIIDYFNKKGKSVDDIVSGRTKIVIRGFEEMDEKIRGQSTGGQ